MKLRTSFLTRGLLLVIFGFAMLLVPDITLYAVTILFSALAILVGIVLVASVPTDWLFRNSLVPVALGALSILAGVYGVVRPDLAELVLVQLFAVYFILQGLFDLFVISSTDASLRVRVVQYIIALAYIVSGILFMALPNLGALALVWYIGLQSVITGLMMLLIARWLKKSRGISLIDISMGL